MKKFLVLLITTFFIIHCDNNASTNISMNRGKNYPIDPSFFKAAQEGDFDTIKRLIDNEHADTYIDARDDSSYILDFGGNKQEIVLQLTALQYASYGANILEELVNPTDIPVAEGYIKIVDYLLKHGANANITVPEGAPLYDTTRAIHIAGAIPRENKEIIELYKKYTSDADLNATDINGRNALHYAIKFSSIKNIAHLLDAGININLKDNKNGFYPIDYARDNNTGALNTQAIDSICQDSNDRNIKITGHNNDGDVVYDYCKEI